jgi:putative salt-induced outer membrane protein YdiY
MLTHRHAALVLALTLIATPPIDAQEKKPPPPTEFSTDLGFVSVSGNTSTITLAFAEKLIRRIPRWEFRQEFGTVYGETDGAQTSNMLRALLRADYGLNGVAIYARGAFDKNKFAGVDSRFGEGIGLAWRVKATDINQLNLEGGFELNQQDNLDGTSENFTALRAASTWKHIFSENSYFFVGLEFLPNLDTSEDYRINSETSVVVPLSSHVAMKASYIIRFDNLPSMNAAGTAPLLKSDRILSTGIQVSF